MTRAERNRALARRGGLASGVSFRAGRVAAGKNPATCDVIYPSATVEFMLAIERYKRERHCPFPTCGDILRVIKELGYELVAAPESPR